LKKPSLQGSWHLAYNVNDAHHPASPPTTEQSRSMDRPFRSRAEAMLDVLTAALPAPQGELMLRALRSGPVHAPTAISVLIRRDFLSPDDVTDAEAQLMIAESLIQRAPARNGTNTPAYGEGYCTKYSYATTAAQAHRPPVSHFRRR
ncbi:hypothetical protein ACFV3E_46175, partial [Streptomyces sp. NPDC059718]